MKKVRVIAILEPKTSRCFTTAELNSFYHEKIDEAIKDPNVHIILSRGFVFAIKYLHTIGFRNCLVYCMGDSTSDKFKSWGGFTSLIELEEALKQDSTEIIQA